MKILCFFFCLFIPILAFSAETTKALIELNISTIEEMWDWVKNCENQGAKISLLYPPDIVIGDFPSTLETNTQISNKILSLYRAAVDIEVFRSKGLYAMGAAYGWNNNFCGLEAENGLVEENYGMATLPSAPKVYSSKKILPRVSAEVPPIPTSTMDTTSEYMLGTVAVRMMFMESDGSIEPSTEDWTEQQMLNVISEVQKGYYWWTKQVPQKSYLQFCFTIEIEATGYEPIQHSGGTQTSGDILWIQETMNERGYTETNAFDQTRHFAHNLRLANGCDWGFVLFMVNDLNDTDNKFSNGVFAYSWLGGPFSVITYEIEKWTIANMDLIAAHELGHIFYALDEYSSAGQSCCKNAGYLSIKNANSAYQATGSICCEESHLCIMREVVWDLCYFTTGQLGLWDTDRDGIPDLVDTPATITLNSEEKDNYWLISGKMALSTVKNLNPETEITERRDITIDTINQIEFCLDEGSWYQASAEDGAFDEFEELYSIKVFLPDKFTHTLKVKGISKMGIVTTEKQVSLAASGSLFGDANCDNEVTPQDALIAFQIYLQQYTGNEGCVIKVDFDGDNKVTPQDALSILNIYLFIPSTNKLS